MSTLWSRIEYTVETGNERAKFDLKRTLDLSDKAKRAHFAKDVLAMANTRGGPGYIIVGVLDNKDRQENSSDYVVGFSAGDTDALERLVMQTLDHYCSKPIPDVHYEELVHPQTKKSIGIVVIDRAYNRPYVPIRNGDKLKIDEVYLRRGAETFTAEPSEIEVMQKSTQAGYRVLVNFGREISDLQIQQVENLTQARVDEIISVADYRLDDNQPYEAQLIEVVKSIGLTASEWEKLPILINVHPLSPAGAGILAQIHGLRGNFPGILRMQGNDAGEFNVVEILQLQRLRNQTRHWGAQP